MPLSNRRKVQCKDPKMELLAIRITLYSCRQIITSLNLVTSVGMIAIMDGQKCKPMRRLKEVLGLESNDHRWGDYPVINEFLMGCNEDMLENAGSALGSASIIFAHAVVDSVLHQLCSLLVRVDEGPFVRFVSEKKVAFKEVESRRRIDIRKRIMQDFLEHFRMESLLRKCDRLFQILKPSKIRGVLDSYSYSRKLMQSIDDWRHKLLHGLRFGQCEYNSQTMVDFLLNTAEFFIRIAGKKYKLHIDLESLDLSKPDPELDELVKSRMIPHPYE